MTPHKSYIIHAQILFATTLVKLAPDLYSSDDLCGIMHQTPFSQGMGSKFFSCQL